VKNIFRIISDYIKLISRHRFSSKMEIFKSKLITIVPTNISFLSLIIIFKFFIVEFGSRRHKSVKSTSAS